jgi:hypothetical protein
LVKLGEIAYNVSALEWAVLNDPYANHPLLDVSKLLGRSTGQMAAALAAIATQVGADDPQGHFLHVGSMALKDVSRLRNRVLHARPGIRSDGAACLLHLRFQRSGTTESAWIDEPYLDQALSRIDYWTGRVERSSERFTNQ